MASNATARTYKPRTPRKQAAGAGQSPIVLEVSESQLATAGVEFDESDPVGKPDEPAPTSSEVHVHGAAVTTFAYALGHIEELADLGKHELIMQLARIAYTRGRQTARQNGVDLDNGQG
jgi:hypothetical protein